VTRPGVEVVMKGAPPSGGFAIRSGTAFFAGLAERGRTDVAVLIHNMDEYATHFGNRVSYGLLYDACDAAFKKGATDIYVGRVVGPAAVVDSHTFNDAGAAPSIAVDTLGQFDSAWTASVVVGAVAGTAHVVVKDSGGTVLTQSPYFAAPTDFANWSQSDDFIRIRALGANVPAAIGDTALAAGADDRASVTDVVKAAALPKLFPKGQGVGQLAYPGATTVAMQVSLANFAQDTGRNALLDLPDTSDAPTLEAQADGFRLAAGLERLSETFVLALDGWHVIPGVVGGTTRTVPPSAVTAGLIATSDGRFNNPNVPAAAANGIASPYVLRLSRPEWDDATRQALNNKGIASYRTVEDSIRLYGYRTLADMTDPESAAWESFAAARLRMVIIADLDAVGEDFVFDQVDGRGQKTAEFNGAISGMLQQYWARGALYGDAASDAYSVDVGPTVNTPTTLANNELHAKVGLRVSPFAELVYIEVTKVPITEVL
jgi:hypothetical protein